MCNRGLRPSWRAFAETIDTDIWAAVVPLKCVRIGVSSYVPIYSCFCTFEGERFHDPVEEEKLLRDFSNTQAAVKFVKSTQLNMGFDSSSPIYYLRG